MGLAATLSLCSWLLAALVNARHALDALKDVTDASQLLNYLENNPSLNDWLIDATNITILAPGDEAFAALTSSNITQSELAEAVAYHIVAGSYPSFQKDVQARTVLHTAISPALSSDHTGGKMLFAQYDSFMKRTVFTSGLETTVMTTSASPVQFDSGCIHVLDGTLTLPKSFARTARSKAALAYSEALIKQGSSEDDTVSLASLNNITIFLPIDYAWERIGNLVQDWDRSKLDTVISYHVVNGVLEPSADRPLAGEYSTLQGNKLTIKHLDNETWVNNAKIIGTKPYIFEGGVIYSTYSVLNPDNATLPSAVPNTSDVAFEGAQSTTDFTFARPSEISGAGSTDEPAAPSESTSSGSLSLGAKVAIGVGATVGLILASLLITWLIYRRKATDSARSGLTGKEYRPEATQSRKKLIG